jgi:hypothetical protein
MSALSRVRRGCSRKIDTSKWFAGGDAPWLRESLGGLVVLMLPQLGKNKVCDQVERSRHVVGLFD